MQSRAGMHTVTLGRPNLTLMAEADAGPSTPPVLHDSAVDGNVHVGDVVHHHHHVAGQAVTSAQVSPVPTTVSTPTGATAYPATTPSMVHSMKQPLRPGERDLTEAYILCFFLGWFGGHRFYLRQPGLGVLYFLTFGLFGLGWLADMIRMPMMVDRYNLERLPP